MIKKKIIYTILFIFFAPLYFVYYSISMYLFYLFEQKCMTNCAVYIAPCFLKFYLQSPGAVFIPIISTKRINQIKKIVRKKFKFMHTKRFNTFFKRWVQFRVGSIPRLPYEISNYVLIFIAFGRSLLKYRWSINSQLIKDQF